MEQKTKEIVERLRNTPVGIQRGVFGNVAMLEEAASLIESLSERVGELESGMAELINSTNGLVGWHRTDKNVVRDEERLDDWQKSRDVARALLSKQEERG